jgi:hypothetical protein
MRKRRPPSPDTTADEAAALEVAEGALLVEGEQDHLMPVTCSLPT